MRFTRRGVARLAVAIVWVFGAHVLTAAGGALVRITAPKDGQAVKGRVRVQADTRAENLAYLIFCVDAARPHSSNCQPYYFDLDTASLADGPHSLAVEVYGRQGLLERSAPVVIQVSNGSASEPTALAKISAASASAGKPAAVAAPLAASPQLAAVPNIASTQPGAIAGPAPRDDTAAPAASQSAASLSPGKASSARGACAQAFAPVLILRPAAALAPVSQRDPRGQSDVATASASRKGSVPPAAGGQALVVLLDGRALSFDVAPAMLGGRAFGGLRALMEQSGGRVDWLGVAKQAIARRGNARLTVTVGAVVAQLDGRPVQLGAAPMLATGRTVVPLRTTCEPLGYRVAWMADSRTVRLVTTDAPVHVGMRAGH